MKFAAIYRSFMLRVPALLADDAVIGAWARLVTYAAEIEAGINVSRASKKKRIGLARLRDCRSWDGEQWNRATGTNLVGIERVVAANLARWRGPDLIVEGYDIWGQRRSAQNLALLQEFAPWGKAGSSKEGLDRGPQPKPSGETSIETVDRGSPLPSPPLRGSGSGSEDPEGSSHPSPKGGTGGARGDGMRAPLGAGDPGTGPEGFERWWGESYPKAFRNWREGVLELWVSQDLEGEADEIISFTDHQKRTRQWRQRGPEGQPHYYVPTPWKLLTVGAWRKPGPWNTPAAAAPERTRSNQSAPEVVDLQAPIDATVAHRHLMEFLADVDVSEERKETERRRWVASNPGEVPPWARQPDQQQNGRSS